MRRNSNIPYNCLVLFIVLLDCTKTSQQQWVHRQGSYQKNCEMIVYSEVFEENITECLSNNYCYPKRINFFCQLQVCFLQKLLGFWGIKIPGCKPLAKVMGQIYNNQYIIINRINEQNHLISIHYPKMACHQV